MTTPSYKPVWTDRPLPDYPQLSSDVTCDVCIVGGGMAGLLVAERLLRDGVSVVVLDASDFAGGETSRTTAHLVTALDDRYMDLQRMHGRRGAHLAAESQTAALDHLEWLATRLDLDCDWSRVDGYLVVNERHADKEGDLLASEHEAATAAGIAVERVDRLPAPWPSDLGPALRFPRQAQMHPLRLLHGIAQHLVASGVRLYGKTQATSIHGGRAPRVDTNTGHRVSCSDIVVATNTPVHNLVAMHTKQAGYQTYVSAFAVSSGALPPLLLWDGLWADDDSYRYIRLAPQAAADGGDLLLVGGEDHKTGQGPDGDAPFRRLESWAARHFGVEKSERRWSGEVMEPADGLGYIGHDAGGRAHVFVVTGDSGTGITNAAIAALLLPDLIAGRAHPWQTLYDPSRKVGPAALKTYVRENINTVAQYRDWLTRGDAPDASAIPPGGGAIIVEGIRHLAVSKDDRGRCTRLSAVCPHLGGVVRWNDQEKTWDCPCHASRFDRAGRVIHGPANSDLAPADGASLPQTAPSS